MNNFPTPLISPEIEQRLQHFIFPDLEKGRKGFDLYHTQAVVFWTKKLLENIDSPSLDPLVSITAAYAHDWGYFGLFDGVDKRSIELVHKMKPLHMERGSEMIHSLLTKEFSEDFTASQISRTAHLVKVHDLVEQVKDEDELLIMEADTLGMLDTDIVKPTYSKEDNDIFLEREVRNRRFKYFEHQYAKKVGEEVILKRIAFYQ